MEAKKHWGKIGFKLVRVGFYYLFSPRVACDSSKQATRNESTITNISRSRIYTHTHTLQAHKHKHKPDVSVAAAAATAERKREHAAAAAATDMRQ